MDTQPLFRDALNKETRPSSTTRRGLAIALTAAVAATPVFIAANTSQAQAVTSSVTVKASADSYTAASAGTTNYGTTKNLRLNSQSLAAKISYLRFSVPAQSNGTIAKAELVLTRTARHLPTTTVSVHKVTSATWGETALTYKNAPTAGSTVATSATSFATTTVTLDVTAAVKAGATTSFALTSPVKDDAVQFVSREGGAAGPHLVLTVKPTTTTTAPTTTSTTTGTPTTAASTTVAPSTPSNPACTVSKLLVSSCGRWLGVAAQAYSPLTSKAAMAVDEDFSGSPFAIAHVYNTNGKLFPSASDISLATEAGRNRLLFENWKPATNQTWAQIAAGGSDARIDTEAAYLKSTFNLPFFLSVWHEPENDVNLAAGSGMTPTDYQAMFRHVVQRVRGDGANKFVSVMNYMGFGRWDSMVNSLYPGDDVVDWIAYDPYQYSPGTGAGHDFKTMVNAPYKTSPGFYTWATTTHPSKPLMLGEWGGFYSPADPAGQAAFFNTVASQIGAFPALKAYVYFDMNLKYHNHNGKGTAPNSTPASLGAWKAVVQLPVFNTPSIKYVNGTVVAVD